MTDRSTRAQARAAREGAGRGAAQPKKTSRGRRWLKRSLLAIVALGLLGLIGVGIAYARVTVPDPNELATAQASIIYYADGKSEMARLADPLGNRESVPISAIPEDVRNAMIAAEDRSFYENDGISPTGIARAVWVAVKGGGEPTQGGSTITQQYVKNYFLTQDQTLTRKAKEILIAIKIDKQQTKDEILANYFNTIYYGRGAYGIQTASKAYFNKNSKDLTVEEGALLSAIIRGPSLYDPGLGAEQEANAKERWGYILDAMVAEGWLTAEKRAAAEFPEVREYKPRALGGATGYLVDMIKRELVGKHKLTETDIDRGGLRVVSTIDKPKQAAAQKAVKDGLPSGAKDVRGALVSITPGDGAIVALYGGSDFAKRPQNGATQDKMQAGSTFKIFTLIAALQEKKVNIRSVFPGFSPQYFDEFEDPNATTDFKRRGGVRNYGNSQYGTINLIKATGSSVNTVYAALNVEATPEASMKAAQAAGVTSKLSPNPGNVLGTDYVTVLDMASAYATIAANGLHADPYIVKQVKFADEDVPTITVKKKTQQVFDKALISDVIECMRAPVQSGTATYAQALGRPAAGKTGTSESYRSAWFDGFTPQLATAVGLYRPGPEGEELTMENLPGIGSITGGSYPVQIWTAYMIAALEGTDTLSFPDPAYINKDVKPPPVQAPPTTPKPTTAKPTLSATAPPTTSAPPTSDPPPSNTDPGPTKTPPGHETTSPTPVPTG